MSNCHILPGTIINKPGIDNKYRVQSGCTLIKLPVRYADKNSPVRYGLAAKSLPLYYVCQGKGDTVWYVIDTPNGHAWKQFKAPAPVQKMASNLGNPSKSTLGFPGKSTLGFPGKSTLGSMRYWKTFIPQDMATFWFNALKNTVPFQVEYFKIFGKTQPSPRTSYAYGDAGLSYRYAGTDRVSPGWTHPIVWFIKQLVELTLGIQFNYVLLNLYTSGEQYIGWHADSEKDIVPGSTIASVSLGATREFQIRSIIHGKSATGRASRKDGPIIHSANTALSNGSLVTMEGAFQKNYKHSVPQQKSVKGARINLTFRQIIDKRDASEKPKFKVIQPKTTTKPTSEIPIARKSVTKKAPIKPSIAKPAVTKKPSITKSAVTKKPSIVKSAVTKKPSITKPSVKKSVRPSACNAPRVRKNPESGSTTVKIPASPSGLCKYEVSYIPGLYIIPDFITAEQEKVLIKTIIAQKWQNDLKREVQHYGYRYDYTTKKVTKLANPALPKWALMPIEKAQKLGLVKKTPDQLIINKYEPGEGICHHIDRQCFDDTIISLSLQSPVSFEYAGYKGTEYDGKKYLLWLQPRSLLIMRGDARWKFTHCIPPNKFDYVKEGMAVPYADRKGAKKVARGTRISLTYRNVLTGCK